MKPIGDNLPVTGQIPPPVSTALANPNRPAAPIGNRKSAIENPPTDSHWHLPGGRDGLRGSVPKVLDQIQSLADVPAHFRETLTNAVQAAIEGTDHNYAVLRAHGNIHRTVQGQRHIVLLDLQTRHENI